MTVPLERRLDTSLDQCVQRNGHLGLIDIHLVVELCSRSQCCLLLGFRLTGGVMREREVTLHTAIAVLRRLLPTPGTLDRADRLRLLDVLPMETRVRALVRVLSPGTSTIPVVVYSKLRTGLTPTINALSVVLIIVTLVVVLSSRKLSPS